LARTAERDGDTDAARARLRALIAEKSLLIAPPGKPFALASGRSSPYLIDLKLTCFDPEGISLIADLLLAALDREKLDGVGGMETGGIPLAAAVCQRSHAAPPPLPGFFVRKQAKDRGAGRRIEGVFAPGARVALVEDVTTTGGSILQAVEAVREAGGEVAQLVTVVDRLEGARDNLAAAGIALTALFTKEDFGL